MKQIHASVYIRVCIYVSVSLCLFASRAWVHMNICVYPKKSENVVYVCVSNSVHACIDMSRGFGLPWCDRAGARRVSGSHGPTGSL